MAEYSYTAIACGTQKTPKGGASAFVEGTYAAGILSSERYALIAVFDADTIAGNIGSGIVTDASLSISRDAAYGTKSIGIRVIPGMLEGLPGSQITLDQAKGLMQRGSGKDYALTGSAPVIGLCGACMAGLQEGSINAFMLLPADEAAGEYMQLKGVTLKVTVSGSSMNPVWRRNISEGDLLWDEDNSLIADMKELRHYVNVRRRLNSLTVFDWGALEESALSDLAGMILLMRTQLNEALTAENKSLPEYTALASGDYPMAEHLNELRRQLYAVETAGTLTYESVFSTRMELEMETTGMPLPMATAFRWYAYAPTCGTYYADVLQDDGTYKKRKYLTVGYWVLQNAAGIVAALSGKTVTGAKLTLTRRSTNTQFASAQNLILYGTTLAVKPTGNVSIGTIYTGTVCAQGSISVGQTKEYVLNASAIAGLKNGAIKGFGLREDSGYTPMESYAKLVLEVSG